MEITKIGEKIKLYFKKYRYVALILAIGLLFMLIPAKSNMKEKTETTVTDQTQQPQISTEELLAEILSCVEGAGKVQVLLTKARGEETVYQTDINNSQVSTVIVSDADRAQEGLVIQVNPPAYLGAIIVCQGADSPSVRLAVVEAVSNVTGLGTDRISVLKMK